MIHGNESFKKSNNGSLLISVLPAGQVNEIHGQLRNRLVLIGMMAVRDRKKYDDGTFSDVTIVDD
jgi:hypothetical protein